MPFKIEVQVKTRSNPESVEQLDLTHFVIRVNVPPVEGAANRRVIELLSDHLNIPKSRIELILGMKSKKKVFLISDGL